MVGGRDDESNKDNKAEGKEDRPGRGVKRTEWRRELCSNSVPFQRVTLDSLININTLPLKINKSL